MLNKRHDEVVLTLRAGRETLACRVWLEEVCAGWLVVSAEGRVGSTLLLEHQTAKPVPREAADAILQSVVVAKTRRGYTARAGQRHREACGEIRRAGRRVVGF